MKKFIASLIAVSMIATPVMAQHRNGHNRGYERHDSYKRHHHRGIRTGEAVAIGLGALILGAAIAKNNRREREVVYQDYRTQVCQDIIKYDYYGNPYVAGRNCWYQ
jgi:Ni/Co efflux regulator RcnB